MTEAQRRKCDELIHRGWEIVDPSVTPVTQVVLQDPQHCLWLMQVCGRVTRTSWYEIRYANKETV
jgi:hypothetical protein